MNKEYIFSDIHRSATTLKPLTGELNNIDHLITMAPVKGWDILGSEGTVSSCVDVLEAGKMGKRKDLSDFHKGQIVMARRLGLSISRSCGVFPVCGGQYLPKWSKIGQPVNRRQGHGGPRLFDACEERRLARLVRSQRSTNCGYDRKMSERMVNRSLLRMGPGQSLVRGLMLTP